MAIPVYGIFEGGGAKGLGHIAALKAAERSELEFIGVAGASAGALIATLAAVGYKADELFDPDAPLNNLLSRIGITPLSLLGEREWTKFETAQRRGTRAAHWGVCGGFLAACLVSLSAVRVAREIRSTGGYFTTEYVRETLNGFLRTKLQMHHANAGREVEVPERVGFRDINPIDVPECCSLKIVVTDVTNQRMVVFGGPPEFDGVEVAEAVAASIAIPMVFKPVRIPSFTGGGNALYADGGLVSNLPIWVFAEEKLNYERIFLPLGKVPVVAFSLTDALVAPPGGQGQAPQPRPAPGSLGYWAGAARAAIFGGQTVAQLFAADLRQIQIPIRLGVTEFNFTVKRALDGYYDAYFAAARKLVREMHLLPARRVELLRGFHDRAMALIRAHPHGADVQSARVSLLRPVAGTNSFRIENSYNMDRDADDRLVFSRLAKGAPVAFDNRAPAYLDFTAEVQNMTKYELALLRPTLKSAISLPIFDQPNAWEEQEPANRPQPVGVVSIDSDQDLAQVFSDHDAMKVLATESLKLAAAL